MLINQTLLQQRGTRQPTAGTRDSITSLPVPLPSNMARKAPICALRTILRDRNTHSNVALDGSKYYQGHSARQRERGPRASNERAVTPPLYTSLMMFNAMVDDGRRKSALCQRGTLRLAWMW